MNKQHKQSLLRYRRIIFLVGLPVFIAAISLVITNLYYRNKDIQKLREFYSFALRQTAARCEERINSVVDNGEFFLKDIVLDRAMQSDVPPNAEETESIEALMQRFQSSGKIVESIYILNVEEGYVVGDGGVYSLAEWYATRCVYANYALNYWNSVRFFDSSPYKVLSPTMLSYQEKEEVVLPVLLKWSNHQRSKNIMVFNIGFADLIDMEYGETFYRNFPIYMLNRYNGSVFGGEWSDVGENIAETELYRGLVSGKNLFSCRTDEGKSLIVSYATSNKLVGYTYFTVIPYSYINRVQFPNILLSFGIGIPFVFLALFFAVKGGGAMIRPYHRLMHEEDNGDVLKNAENEIEALIQRDEEMKVVRPYVQERYLVNYLNADDYYLADEAKEVLGKMLSFPDPYFAVVAFWMQSNDRMHQNYTEAEYVHIYSGFYEVVRSLFEEKFCVQVLPAEREMLYIILNMPDKDRMDEAEKIVSELLQMLRTDMDCIDLFVGTSGVYESLEGLKQAHREAMDNLKLAPKPKIQFEVYERFNNNQVGLSGRNEAFLFSAMVDGRIDEALKKLEELREKVSEFGEKGKKQFYLQILNVVLRARGMKGIVVEGRMDYEIYGEYAEKSAEDIYRKICVFLEEMPERGEKQASKNKKDQVLQFIDENYQDPNLSREMIAEQFHIQPNYLSILVKNKIGITFKEYVTNLRILRAKELLAQKEKSIQEIYEESGFASKQTFYRTFKNEVGLTPDEYRWSEKKE